MHCMTLHSSGAHCLNTTLKVGGQASRSDVCYGGWQGLYGSCGGHRAGPEAGRFGMPGRAGERAQREAELGWWPSQTCSSS